MSVLMQVERHAGVQICSSGIHAAVIPAAGHWHTFCVGCTQQGTTQYQGYLLQQSLGVYNRQSVALRRTRHVARDQSGWLVSL